MTDDEVLTEPALERIESAIFMTGILSRNIALRVDFSNEDNIYRRERREHVWCTECGSYDMEYIRCHGPDSEIDSVWSCGCCCFTKAIPKAELF